MRGAAKKNLSSPMKNIINLGIMAAAVMLAGCGKSDSNNSNPPAQSNTASPPPVVQPTPAASGTNQPMTDVEIRQKIVGTWTLDDPQSQGTFAINADGTLVAKGNDGTRSVEMNMNWQVNNGFLIVSGKDNNGAAEGDTNKILTLNDHALILQDEDDTVTFHR